MNDDKDATNVNASDEDATDEDARDEDATDEDAHYPRMRITPGYVIGVEQNRKQRFPVNSITS